MAAEALVLEQTLHRGQVLHLTLNQPKGNILSMAMVEALVSALARHDTPSLKAIVLDGTGDHFSFGASVEEHKRERAAEMLAAFHGLFRVLFQMSVPTFAAVRGQCKGGGMELASYCSWIFASADAVFGQPEIKLAVFAPMASLLLPWRLGAGRAIDICVSGRSIRAEEAHQIGLVHAIASDPTQAAIRFAEEHLLSSSASSLRFAERAARLDLERLFQEALPALEERYVTDLMETPDANEGIRSFLEKRKPVFEASVSADNDSPTQRPN